MILISCLPCVKDIDFNIAYMCMSSSTKLIKINELNLNIALLNFLHKKANIDWNAKCCKELIKDATSVTCRSKLFTSYNLTMFKQQNLLP